MPRVIERHGTEIVDGRIIHDDRPSAFSVADRLAGRRLDRRFNYAIIGGTVFQMCNWTSGCSGCTNGHEDAGSGCSECGYRGRVRRSEWVPVKGMTYPDLQN